MSVTPHLGAVTEQSYQAIAAELVVDGSWWTVRGGRFVVDGSWWTVRGGRFVVDGSWWTWRT
jgi:hypothetical protein